MTEQCVITQSGVDLSVRADTVCIHSDTPDAVQLLAQVRERLEAGGVRIRAC
ncbi:MAG: LamB/YcsF family protein [Planctomycetaceae bacterium]